MFRFINSTNTEKPSTVQDFDDVSVKEYLQSSDSTEKPLTGHDFD